MKRGDVFLQVRSFSPLYAAAGALAGLLCGFLGAGGGLLLVPILSGPCRLSPRRALATSVSIMLPLCVLSLIPYLRAGALEFSTALPYLLGGFLGGLICDRCVKHLPEVWLRRIFTVLLCWGGIRNLFF